MSPQQLLQNNEAHKQGLKEVLKFLEFAWKNYYTLDFIFYFKSSSQKFRFQIIKHPNTLQINRVEFLDQQQGHIINHVEMTPKQPNFDNKILQLSQVKQPGLPLSPWKSQTVDNLNESHNQSQRNDNHSNDFANDQQQLSYQNEKKDLQDQFNDQYEIINDENNFNDQSEKNDSQLQQKVDQQQQIVIEQQNIIKGIKIRFHQNGERQGKVAKILKSLLMVSSEKRAVDIQLRPYIRDRMDLQELCKNYSLNMQSKQQIKKLCNGMINVRGDGNCFYTAFGYQFLNILICQYSNEEYDNFIDEIEKLNLNFIIQHQDFQEYDKETEKELLNEFLFRVQNLRLIENNQEREYELFNQFSEFEIENNGKGCLGVLSTIFFRNLSNQILEQSELKDQVFDRVNLLIWEEQCNNNEIIILCLAQFCQITVELLYMDDKTFVEKRYNDGKLKQIILLIKPGHYNIGLLQ